MVMPVNDGARTKRDGDRKVLALLCAGFPRTFFPRQDQRRPLKIGIHHDLAAALGGAISRRHLSQALWFYTTGAGYLAAQRDGAERIDLDGNGAGCVSAEEAERAAAALAQNMTALSKCKPKKETPPAPVRDGLAALREAAQKRRAPA